jgi:hypothetical protein
MSLVSDALMRLLCLASITIVIVLGSIVVATPINAHIINRLDEIYKETTLYSLTFPPGKAEHLILCHPIRKALAAANNANLQFNAGEMAAAPS